MIKFTTRFKTATDSAFNYIYPPTQNKLKIVLKFECLKMLKTTYIYIMLFASTCFHMLPVTRAEPSARAEPSEQRRARVLCDSRAHANSYSIPVQHRGAVTRSVLIRYLRN